MLENERPAAHNFDSFERWSSEGQKQRAPMAAEPFVSLICLRYGDACQFRPFPGNSLRLVQSTEPGTTLTIPKGWFSITLPISGHICVTSENMEWELEPGRYLACDHQVQFKTASGGAWLCLCGSGAAWDRACGELMDIRNIFPIEDNRPLFLEHHLERLCSETRESPGSAIDLSRFVQGIAIGLYESQRELRALTNRCPGRNRRRRKWMMLRLLRIRHAIASAKGERMKMADLSRRMNCSIGHLSRTYQDVFGETPFEYSMRLRLGLALELVKGTDMAFCDVAETTGFDNQSSFTRAFKRFHGITPTHARSMHGLKHGSTSGRPCTNDGSRGRIAKFQKTNQSPIPG